MNIKEWLKKINSKILIFTIASLILALIIFRAGMFVGYHQASFSYNFGERYYQSFGRGNKSFMPMMGFSNFREEFGSTFGTSGKIIKIMLPKIIIEGQDNTEKIVALNEEVGGTTIRHHRDTIKATDLKVGDNIIVLGSPDDNAEIDAKLIRVIPEISATSTSRSK